MPKKLPPKDLIIQSIHEKSVVKQDVYHNTIKVFRDFRTITEAFVKELRKSIKDKRIIIECRDMGEFEFQLKVAGDVLIFYMHTNVFDFDKSHHLWKTSYLKDENNRSYCGTINIYNFLEDSFKYNRQNDLGYLIGRVFVNKEMHYFMEGKRQLGLLYNDFANAIIDKNCIRQILESTVLYCLNFDLLTPPFDAVKEVSVMDMLEASESMKMVQTGKRLGFRFQADTDHID